MATNEVLTFNAAHAPKENAIEAFKILLPTLKAEIVKSRHHWAAHEPRMWERAQALSDHELVAFTIEDDLVEVRSAPTSYGTIILGKIRLPKVNDAEGEGFVHVRIHDPPNHGSEDVTFHSLFTEEIRPDPESPPTGFRAIQTSDKPLQFFNE
ncbi:hypothetical protein HYPSUDRAFT_42829 [Hypholoma sublateritium FD-334 SS-4]|uniref:Uncharacterized protein n=1 Tax=Hypholoma sublateritium (strain FD-334 SS-4) TaxID=945553 RepID=A0A0D2PLG2_HYPSF|nr:hypothetical protein HYPSUDRAFT_42829 [Hypholoma sublateritium FD-334 SS-4]